jgi:mannose/fructose/N-acetylgalactosamine-specific phosphotransferase system component IIC
MSLIGITLLGGIVGLDATSAPQVMLSRPLVAATLAGLVAGRPAEGLLIGAILEVFALMVLPIGAARYPETGTAAVAVTAAYAETAASGLDAGVLLMAVVFGLVWERVTGASVTRARRLNERVVESTMRAPGNLAVEVERRHVAAMLLDFVRGAVVTLVGALSAMLLLRIAAPFWSLGQTVPLAVLVLGVVVMLTGTLPLFGGWRDRRLAFSLGVICGLLLILLR